MEARQTIFDKLPFLDAQTELTEEYAQVETPAGLRGIELYPHQATVVRALLDMEDRRVIKVRTGDYEELTDGEVVVETSAMVLSEPFGSGKTAEILSLILLRPVPKAIPAHANSITLKASQITTGAQRNRKAANTQLFKHEITRRFTSKSALIRPNLIVVGSSVLVQWENAIKEFTNLKFLTIGDYYKLQKFMKLYNEKKINGYDVILLKNGKVTGNFLLPGEDPSEVRDIRSLITVVGKITAENCWSRVIYDDFDTIAIPAGSQAINALFTVYVSATTKSEPSGKAPLIKYKTLAEAISQRATPPLTLVVKDKTLFSNFNIRNTGNYVEASTKITKIQGYRYVYANPDDNYIRLLGAMGENDANEVMEMLNGDAIATAAERLGIKTTSVADIFQRMLDKKYEKYMHDQYVLELLERIREEGLNTLEPHPEGKKHSLNELEAIRKDIVKASSTNKRLPDMRYYSVSLEQMIDEMTTEYQLAKEQDGLAINRVIDNIKEGACQVCALPLAEFDTFIVRCCGLILCDICGIRGCSVQKRYDYKLKRETICGSCANCKATVYPEKDLIFVDKNFDMEALLKAKGDEKPAEPLPEVETPTEEPKPDEPEIKNPKLKALLAICRGKTPEACEEIPINIPHLLQGRVDIPPTLNQERKVLVFANFNETLSLVENFLVEHGITFLRLGGTYQEKAETAKKFKTYGTVLLINSQQNCAGLHLAHATDTVFMHKITDHNIEAQVSGRAQRIGRTCNLRIHYICYQNEKNMV